MTSLLKASEQIRWRFLPNGYTGMRQTSRLYGSRDVLGRCQARTRRGTRCTRPAYGSLRLTNMRTFKPVWRTARHACDEHWINRARYGWVE